MKNKLHYDQGFAFPGGGLIIGAMLIVGSLFILVVKPFDHSVLIAAICLPLGLLFFSTQGVEIDPGDNSVYTYYSLFGLRKGKKRPLSDFSHVALSKQGISLGSANYRGVRSKERIEAFNLLLVNKTQTLQQLISYCTSQYDAQGEAIALAEALHFEIAEYNPPVKHG